MPAIDVLTSPTLKHLRASWWNDEFTEFLAETLKPRPGKRILDVGCGPGTGEFQIGRLHVSQLRLVGMDVVFDKVSLARRELAAHNIRAAFAAGDALRLPFRSGVFDATYCVAVLQHVDDVDAAIREFARVTAPGGRVLVVEPDNANRYFHSSVAAGREALDAGAAFFAALTSRGDRTEASSGLGPRLPGILAQHGIEPVELRLFPVVQAQLGVPERDFWTDRRASVERAIAGALGAEVRAAGQRYRSALAAYEADASRAGASFVEIQHAMLFATVGQRAA